jgi:undecaprenyl diphosphate synthase
MTALNEDAAARIRPRHVAVIMDGNGRWARARGLPRAAGHRAGVKAARALVEACGERGIGVLTLFAFSSENWNRPRSEVGALMKLMLEALDREVGELSEKGVRLLFIGDRDRLSDKMLKKIDEAEARTADNDALTLVIALAYGGRWDIVAAVRQAARLAEAGRLDPESIDEAAISGLLSLGNLPDPDLLIRTGGELRISNFLLWNLAYAELYFTERLWPEFDSAALDDALAFYAGRQRRFGRTPSQAAAQ